MLAGNFYVKNISGPRFSWRLAVDVVCEVSNTPGALVGQTITGVFIGVSTRVLLVANGVSNGVWVNNTRAPDLTAGASALATIYYVIATREVWCCRSGDLVGVDTLIFDRLTPRLSQLQDVSLSTLTVNDVLSWNGTAWVNSAAVAGSDVIHLNSGGNVAADNFLRAQSQAATEDRAQLLISTNQVLRYVSVKTVPALSANLTVTCRVNAVDAASFVLFTGSSFTRETINLALTAGDLISVKISFTTDPNVRCIVVLEM